MLGALISAGSSLLGGLLGNKSAEKAADKQARLQEKFAKTGIQWKVEDAKKAGVHPLYALGANTIAYSPQSVGDSLGPAIAQAGQDIGRAVDTGRSSGERLQARLGALQVQRAELENQKLASEIALMHQPGTPPAPVTEKTIIDGQTQAALQARTTILPQEVTATFAGRPHHEPAAHAGLTYDRVHVGNGQYGYKPLPAPKIAEAMESSWDGPVDAMIRNRILPSLGMGEHYSRPPADWLPAKHGWKWSMNPLTGVWEPIRER